MPRKPADDAPEAPEVKPAEEVLVPFSVILDGKDVTILARDEEDLKARIARRRAAPSEQPSPLNLE